MHQPPAQVGKQSVDTVLADLGQQKKRMADAIEWIGNVRDGVRTLITRGQVDCTNTDFVNSATRHCEIALTLPTPKGVQDIPVFTIVCSYTVAEIEALMSDPMASIEAIQQAMHQRWLKAYNVRPFESWLVPEATIWRGGEVETTQWLTKQVRDWIGYWFNASPRVAFKPRSALSIDFSGKRT